MASDTEELNFKFYLVLNNLNLNLNLNSYVLLVAPIFDCTILDPAQGSGIRESHYVNASPYKGKSLKAQGTFPPGTHPLPLVDHSPG